MSVKLIDYRSATTLNHHIYGDLTFLIIQNHGLYSNFLRADFTFMKAEWLQTFRTDPGLKFNVQGLRTNFITSCVKLSSSVIILGQILLR